MYVQYYVQSQVWSNCNLWLVSSVKQVDNIVFNT